MALLKAFRSEFHASLLGGALTISKDGVVSIADKNSRKSKEISALILNSFGRIEASEKQKGQSSGLAFEDAVAVFLKNTLAHLPHLMAGKVEVGRNDAISSFQQYEHLATIDRLVKDFDELKAALGADYVIKPDVFVFRCPEPDHEINKFEALITSDVANLSSLRSSANSLRVLKAVVSCKWTLRSDRAQNARTEGLNLLKNRKGNVPHIVVVTAEPMPSRLASLAFGTGEIDMVYHFALSELVQAVDTVGDETGADLLRTMIEGRRLRDISDLPFDIAI